MTPPIRATPREFGLALRRAREAGPLSLDAISTRTKIGVRLLTGLEEGNFACLPNRVFARMFVRQYLELIGEPAEEWLPAFEDAWRQFADSSQPLPLGAPVRVKGRRLGPWAIGLAVVAAAGAAVYLSESRREPRAAARTATAPSGAEEAGRPGSAAAPTEPRPAVPAGREAPATAVSTVATPAPVATPTAATTLVVSAPRGPCWVEVRVAGESSSSRLLAAGAVWQVPAAGRAVDLVLGDAGAASVSYLGEVHDPAGRPGQVARLHLAGTTQATATP